MTPEKNHPLREENHVVLVLKSVIKATATALLRGVLVLVPKDASVFHLGGGISAIASVGNGRRPHPRLRPEAFEILPSGKHQGFTFDTACASVSESVACHATACPPQRAVRSILFGGFAPCGRQGSAHRLSLGPHSRQKRSGESADRAYWWYMRLSPGRACRFRRLHGIPPPVSALLDEREAGIVLEGRYSGHGSRS